MSGLRLRCLQIMLCCFLLTHFAWGAGQLKFGTTLGINKVDEETLSISGTVETVDVKLDSVGSVSNEFERIQNQVSALQFAVNPSTQVGTVYNTGSVNTIFKNKGFPLAETFNSGNVNTTYAVTVNTPSEIAVTSNPNGELVIGLNAWLGDVGHPAPDTSEYRFDAPCAPGCGWQTPTSFTDMDGVERAEGHAINTGDWTANSFPVLLTGNFDIIIYRENSYAPGVVYDYGNDISSGLLKSECDSGTACYGGTDMWDGGGSYWHYPFLGSAYNSFMMRWLRVNNEFSITYKLDDTDPLGVINNPDGYVPTIGGPVTITEPMVIGTGAASQDDLYIHRFKVAQAESNWLQWERDVSGFYSFELEATTNGITELLQFRVVELS